MKEEEEEEEEEKWRPVRLMRTQGHQEEDFDRELIGEIIPGYKVSNKGRMIGQTGKLLKIRDSKKNTHGGPKGAFSDISITIPREMRRGQQVSSVDTNSAFPGGRPKTPKIHLKDKTKAHPSIHKLVKETFDPITDEIPPKMANPVITQEEWDATPRKIKHLIKAGLYIDHIDDDPFNNKIENLQYVTPRQNNAHIKRKSTVINNNNNNQEVMGQQQQGSINEKTTLPFIDE